LSTQEHEVSENAQREHGHDDGGQVFHIEERTSLREAASAWQAMAAMMIVNGQRVTTRGAGL
jgi:hypothetical protein